MGMQSSRTSRHPWFIYKISILICALFSGMEECLDLCAAQVFDEMPSSEFSRRSFSASLIVCKVIGFDLSATLDIFEKNACEFLHSGMYNFVVVPIMVCVKIQKCNV